MEVVMGVKGLIVKGNKVLVLVKPDGRYDFPGGRLERGEGNRIGLRREIREETGLEKILITDLFSPWSFLKKSGFMVEGITFKCVYTDGVARLSPEHRAFRWMPLNKLQGLDIHRKYGLDRFNLNPLRE